MLMLSFSEFLAEFAWVCVRVFFLRRGRVVLSSVYLFFLFAALEYYLPGCFHIARHLAAESGTRFSLPVYMSSLLGVFNSCFGGVFLGSFLLCYFHHMLMI